MTTTMAGQLLINGSDAWEKFGAVMGSGFLNALYAPSSMKDYVEGESRLEHGKSVLTANARQASRELTLSFNLHASTAAELEENRNAFYETLYAGAVTLQVLYPDGTKSGIYKLIYKKSGSYAQNSRRTTATVAVKFDEPDPTDRE